MITSSSLERYSECAASAYLPQVPYTDAAAKKGTINHEDAEAGKLHPKLLADLDGMTDVEDELSFVINTMDRKVRITGKRRNYGPSRSPFDVGTTPDKIGIRGDTVIVRDWKSRKRVTRAERNWQIRTQAVAATVLFRPGVNKINAGIGYLDDGELDVVDFTPASIIAAWVDIHEVCLRLQRVGHIPAEKLVPRAGEHCQYCPALLHCPTQRAMTMAFSSSMDLTQEDINERFMMMTDEQVEDADNQIRIIERKIDMAKAGRTHRLEAGPVRLRDGKYLKLIQSSTNKTDWATLDQVLAQHNHKVEDFQTKTHYLKPMRVSKP